MDPVISVCFLPKCVNIEIVGSKGCPVVQRSDACFIESQLGRCVDQSP